MEAEETIFFLSSEIVSVIFYDISTGFWHSRWRRPMVGILGNFVDPPLILDGYMLNDIWTIVQNHVCNL